MRDRTCDSCDERLEGERVTITTEATDARGVNVELTKRWELCRRCADGIFSSIGEASPWDDTDFKTMVLPDEEQLSQYAGGMR